MTDNPRGIRPIADRVLVQEESEHGHHVEKHGLIYIKDNTANRVCFGRVIAVGPNVSPHWVKDGDVVHFEAECGTPVGEKLLMFRQKDNLLALVGKGVVTG